MLSAPRDGGASRIEFVPDSVIEENFGGWDTVTSSSSYTLPANVENLVLTGAPMWRPYVGTGNELDNVITDRAARVISSPAAPEPTCSKAAAATTC